MILDLISIIKMADFMQLVLMLPNFKTSSHLVTTWNYSYACLGNTDLEDLFPKVNVVQGRKISTYQKVTTIKKPETFSKKDFAMIQKPAHRTSPPAYVQKYPITGKFQSCMGFEPMHVVTIRLGKPCSYHWVKISILYKEGRSVIP